MADSDRAVRSESHSIDNTGRLSVRSLETGGYSAEPIFVGSLLVSDHPVSTIRKKFNSERTTSMTSRTR